jgi:uncharacterized membrane protein
MIGGTMLRKWGHIVLQVAGATLIIVSAWMVGIALGVLVAGVVCVTFGVAAER